VGAFLFVNPRTKRGYRDEFLRRLWKEYSGCNITLYETRPHSTTTDWSGIGPAYDVQKLARRTDMGTTMKYVHVVDGRLKKMVNKGEVMPIKKIKN
jgi:hypothetical protein